jgi:hypothetical protein
MEGKMNYWIFKCNPKYYFLCDRLKDSEAKTTWKVNSDYEDKIRPGDTAFIWRTEWSRGIVARMIIDSAPIIMQDLPHEIKYYRNRKMDEAYEEIYRVEGRYLDRCQLIPSKEIRENNSLSNISALTTKRATNYELNKEQGKKLMELFNKRKDNMIYMPGQ